MSGRRVNDPAELAARIRTGDRTALARGITLVESSRADHQAQAQELLTMLLPDTGGAVRLGLSGAPGVGKSTFTEAFGTYLTGQGHKVLARDPNAFIRPSPAGRTLGGVARRTREAMLLTEAAGFDVVLIETVGVGQSETAVADMVDMFLLLLSPGGGDELQGIKRGIMELADLVVVNKADGDLVPAAKRAAMEYKAALHLMRPKSAHWRPDVLLASALKGQGIAEIWEAVSAHHRALGEAGEIASHRASQAQAWMWTEIREGLLTSLKANDEASRLIPVLEAEVKGGQTTPTLAARRLLGLIFGKDAG